jgi:hypothetical protein
MHSDMSATPLRPVAPARFKRRTTRLTVEDLQYSIDVLTAERQRLRERQASAAALERNRLKIARAQWELSHALIERYLPVDAAA